MNLCILQNSEIDREEWSRLVRESRTGTWFQTPEAYDFFASQPELFHPFVVGVYSHPLPALRGVCVGYVTVEKNPIKQFFTRRAIIIGGPCLADDCSEEEVIELLKGVRETASLQLSPEGERGTAQNPPVTGGSKRGLSSLFLGRDGAGSPIYIETRNLNDYSRWRRAFEKAGFDYQPHLNFHVDCTDKAKMWERLSDNRKRQIKKAIKNGAEIKTDEITEADIKEWYSILNDLYHTRVKTPLFPLSFFLDFFRRGRGKYILVMHEGVVIGGIMCPIMKDKCIYEWYVCGNDTKYKSQNPSVMATYAALDYACERGLPLFDFMGAGQPDEPYGVRDFKSRFGGELVEHGRFLCITKPLLYRIGVLGVKILKGIK